MTKRETTGWTECNAFLVTVSHERDGQIETETITIFTDFGENLPQMLDAAKAALDYAANGIGLDVIDVEGIEALPYPIVAK